MPSPFTNSRNFLNEKLFFVFAQIYLLENRHKNISKKTFRRALKCKDVWLNAKSIYFLIQESI